MRKTLSFSKKREMLEDSCVGENWVYNLTRPVRSLKMAAPREFFYVGIGLQLSDFVFWIFIHILPPDFFIDEGACPIIRYFAKMNAYFPI